MIRLWPSSLFGRLVIILVIGLIVTQFVSVVIFWRDRGRAVDRSAGLELTHRIADTIELLEPLPRAERARLVRRLSRPRLKIRVLDAFRPLPRDNYETTGISLFLSTALRRHLHGDRAIQVAHRISAAPDDGQPAWPKHAGESVPRAASFGAVVALADGAAVQFRFRLPREDAGRPVRLLVWIGVFLASVIVLAFIAVRQTTRPLHALATAAEELGRNINRPPLSETGPGEVQRAARAFNVMQRRIQQAINERSHLLAAISHDLKTPITRLRLRTEMLDNPGLRTKFESDLLEMEIMINETLEFVRGIADREPVQAVNVGALLESLEADARARGSEFQLVMDAEPETYPAQPTALKRCILNLIDNALKYGKRVVVRVIDAPDELQIQVIDDGPGIPEAEIARVFEPFYRVEKSRSRDTGGAGMGLAIAHTVARSLGGEIQLRNLSAGGLQASLRLPRRGKGDSIEVGDA